MTTLTHAPRYVNPATPAARNALARLLCRLEEEQDRLDPRDAEGHLSLARWIDDCRGALVEAWHEAGGAVFEPSEADRAEAAAMLNTDWHDPDHPAFDLRAWTMDALDYRLAQMEAALAGAQERTVGLGLIDPELADWIAAQRIGGHPADDREYDRRHDHRQDA
jgi:hypothetical protein